MQPIVYDISGGQQGFFQGLQLAGMIRTQRQEELKRQKAEADLRRRQEVYSRLGVGATAEDYFRAIGELPEDREAILKSMEQMDDVKKSVMFRTGSEAFAYLQDKDGSIDPEPAAARLEKSAQMFENSGDRETAQQLRDSAKAIRLDPLTGKRVLGTLLAATDPEKFKGIMAVNEGSLTSFQKDLVAAGIDPNSPEGLKQAQDYLSARTAVEINVPGQGVFKGPLSEYKKLYGSDPQAPKAPPAIGEVRNGYRFRGGNPGLQSNWEKVGGQSARADTFQVIGIPGERVTSTKRSPARNAAVGGVPTSYHLSGRARDSVPPRGMSMAEYAAQLRRLNPGMKVINEGDHVHVEPR